MCVSLCHYSLSYLPLLSIQLHSWLYAFSCLFYVEFPACAMRSSSSSESTLGSMSLLLSCSRLVGASGFHCLLWRANEKGWKGGYIASHVCARLSGAGVYQSPCARPWPGSSLHATRPAGRQEAPDQNGSVKICQICQDSRGTLFSVVSLPHLCFTEAQGL